MTSAPPSTGGKPSPAQPSISSAPAGPAKMSHKPAAAPDSPAPARGCSSSWPGSLAPLSPRWLLLENVPGLLTCNKGEDFQVVLATLDELGYGVSWRVLDARYFLRTGAGSARVAWSERPQLAHALAQRWPGPEPASARRSAGRHERRSRDRCRA